MPPIRYMSPIKVNAGAPFDPTTLPNEFFFRADNISGSGVVDTWEDYSTNNRDATKVTGTSWTLTSSTAAINNQPSAQGNNSAYYRFASDGTNILVDANTAFYTYGVVQTPASYSPDFRWFLSVGWYSSSSFIIASAGNLTNYSKIYGGRGNTTPPIGFRNTTFDPTTSVWLTFLIAYNGGGDPSTASNWTLYFNGSNYTAAVTGAGLGIGNVRNFFGAAPNGGQLSTLAHAEIGLVKATLDNPTRDGFFSYWSTRYNL